MGCHDIVEASDTMKAYIYKCLCDTNLCNKFTDEHSTSTPSTVSTSQPTTTTITTTTNDGNHSSVGAASLFYNYSQCLYTMILILYLVYI